ncbi:DUF1203 domain-containing protein [Acidobacteria bacterium ACD]|nr:MAG: DUF1203 domain-containing protein [Acidobacteriota bacterium]MCE7957371.1 DUF1203 domain-containing protein [Acidobacteria bacterium ACB2]MDL1950679.1 DUF1203 domain-containing protein [Acidobacteria bacterium ACD]
MSFRFHALPAELFLHLSDRTDEELAAVGVRRMVVDENPGYPCRVSLSDGEVGEVVYLLSYVHHDVASPYRSAGPIFVREGAATARPAPNEIPPMFRHRLLSVRAYDEAALMVAADVVQGEALEATLRRLLDDPRVSYLHVHNAKPGCFNCRVDRA